MATNYEQQLWEIENNKILHKAILFPPNDKVFDVNLNTRKISVPKFLSVTNDHEAETLYFKFDRYFDYIDLTTKTCIIQYKNAKGDNYIYPVPYYDIQTFADENKVLIPWCIQGAATEAAGTVQFSICWYSTNEQQQLIYCFNTLLAQGIILQGQSKDISNLNIENTNIDLNSDLLQIIQTLEQDYQNGTYTLYWNDI